MTKVIKFIGAALVLLAVSIILTVRSSSDDKLDELDPYGDDWDDDYII